MHRVLIVSRNFPPTGGVGVERVTKFAKYLPQYGWLPTVLTGTRGEFGLRDDTSLANDVEHVHVIRCYAPDIYALYKTLWVRGCSESGASVSSARHLYRSRGPWHPKSWIVPDSQILWVPLAIHAALRAAKHHHWHVVFATISPPTNALIGYQVSRRLGIPLVLDYRDAWTNAFFSPRRPRLLARLEQRLETRIFSAASAVTTLDPSCVVLPRKLVRQSPPVYLVPNGYDEDDFLGCIPVDLPFFSIVHTGNLSSERSLAPLWATLDHALKAEPSLQGKIHFWQVGTIDAAVEAQMKAAPYGVSVHYIPPVTVHEAISYMIGADLLLVQSAGKNMPAKIYQYLRAGRPILALLEKGCESLIPLVAAANVGFACYKNESTLASRFVRNLARVQSRQSLPLKPEILQYSRRELTRKLADILYQVVKARRYTKQKG